MAETATFACNICHEHFYPDIGKEIYTVPCGHVYHKNCLDTWFHTQREQNNLTTCPICRKPADTTQAIRLFLFGTVSNAANSDARGPTDNLKNNFSLNLVEERSDLKPNLKLVCNFITVILLLPVVLFTLIVMLSKLINVLMDMFKNINNNEIGPNQSRNYIHTNQMYQQQTTQSNRVSRGQLRNLSRSPTFVLE